MFKAMYLISRLEGLSKEQFRAHYEENHVKLALGFIGHLLVDYRRNYVEDVGAIPTPGDDTSDLAVSKQCDVVTEMWFRSREDFEQMIEIFSRPDVNKVLVEDENRFIDRLSVTQFIVDECI